MIEGFFIALLGLVIGSFLNVCIYRLPENLSVVYPRSRCGLCGTTLTALDLVPVLSYLVLKGRCRHCGGKFSPRYALVEILTAALFCWCWLVFGLTAVLPGSLILVSFLIVITFIDYDHQLILDKVLVLLAICGLVINLLTGEVGIVDMILSSLGGGGFLLVVALISRGGMGGGDIKFAAALGLWLGWKLLLLTMLGAFMLGGVGGVILLAFKIKGRKDHIPFGPFIAGGAAISLLYGSSILVWYWNLAAG
ncbi:MAG: Prepilin peptidase [Firmicutes bacterium]|nr:Prepilin peptidase [Bacillota bacterium]